MKLAAIYNVWDGVELLPGSMKCLLGHVDMFILVYQDVSNYGEAYKPLKDLILPDEFKGVPISLEKYSPRFDRSPTWNETQKRNAGIEIARISNCTHFLHLDCDEYHPDFATAKATYIDTYAAGSVLRMHTYFKHPTYQLERPEDYFVPFIHKLNPWTSAGRWLGGEEYPFYVDPTRKISTADVVHLVGYMMHHYSWVRKDIGKKIRNSTAAHNIAKGTLPQAYAELDSIQNPEGYYLKDYDRKIIIVPNYFNIQV